jgi:hypothetical protein
VSFSAGIHIPTVLTLTIAFSRRRAVAYWSTWSYCMLYRKSMILTSTSVLYLGSGWTRRDLNMPLLLMKVLSTIWFSKATCYYHTTLFHNSFIPLLSLLEFLLGGPQLAFTDPYMVELISSNIYETKKEGFRDGVPQAAMAGVSFCRQHK